jgi:hypothetical protein
VRVLVRRGAGVGALTIERVAGRVGEEQPVDVGDETGVLHRPEAHRLRDRQVVELAERVGDLEILFERREQRAGDLGGVAGHSLLALGDHHPDGGLRASPGAGVDHRERADAERDEVGGDRLRRRELDRLHSVRFLPLGDRGGVRDRDVALLDVQGDLPGGAIGRFVEAGEGAARESRFELAEGVPVFAVLLAEEALGLDRVELAAIANREVDLAGRELAAEVEAGEVFAAGDDANRALFAARPEGGRLDLEVARVQPEKGGGLMQFELDPDFAGERLLLGQNRQVDLHHDGVSDLGQTELRRLWVRGQEQGGRSKGEQEYGSQACFHGQFLQGDRGRAANALRYGVRREKFPRPGTRTARGRAHPGRPAGVRPSD